MKRFFIALLVLFLVLDISLFTDERFNAFDGKLYEGAGALFAVIKEKGNEKPFGSFNAVEKTVSYKVNKAGDKNGPRELEIFRSCYEDVTFDAEFDKEKNDWLITIKAPVFAGKTQIKETNLWWADGRLLPENELKNRDKYWKLIYPYTKLKDPSLLTKEEIERVRNFSSKQNRQNAEGTPMFFYDFLYAAKSQIIIEDHIIHTKFLGLKTKIHERLRGPLFEVENRIYREAHKDKAVMDFIDSLKSADAYNWRVIEGTGGRKSFHSYGIAIDLLPKKLGGKAIFWSWTRDKDPQNWMLTPFEKRWNPPAKVIEIFEDEGFIWGGNWIIFDNMHFEYHPELIRGNKK